TPTIFGCSGVRGTAGARGEGRRGRGARDGGGAGRGTAGGRVCLRRPAHAHDSGPPLRVERRATVEYSGAQAGHGLTRWRPDFRPQLPVSFSRRAARASSEASVPASSAGAEV